MLTITARRGPGRTVAIWFNQTVAIWLSTKDPYGRRLEYPRNMLSVSAAANSEIEFKPLERRVCVRSEIYRQALSSLRALSGGTEDERTSNCGG